MKDQKKEAIRKLQKLGQRLLLVSNDKRPAKGNGFEAVKAIVQKKWAGQSLVDRKFKIQPPVVSDSKDVRVVVGEPLPPKERSSIKPSSGSVIKVTVRDKRGRVVYSNRPTETKTSSSEGAWGRRQRPERQQNIRKNAAKPEGARPKKSS